MARVMVARVTADELRPGDVLCLGEVLLTVESARTVEHAGSDIYRTDLVLTLALPPEREVSIARAHGRWTDDEIIHDILVTEGANGVTR